MQTNKKFRVAAVIENRYGEYLFIRENDDDYLILPGGEKENNEDYMETCKRELLEELGIHINELVFLGLIENFYILNNQKIEETLVIFKGYYHNQLTYHENNIKREFFWINIHSHAKHFKIKPRSIVNFLIQQKNYMAYREDI
ncbi:NUDIX hydrolase [Frischella sp. Ac13]|uniref:NUDIX hydrolase n=1 Tax=Frischella japonica TaxID=2741544 RepID=A0ABR7QUY7_9GAMM|nr:NUDIX hydrolase [Frischella japonica]MBC9129945.1 NUDIX hydrolase [Frischella japonica]